MSNITKSKIISNLKSYINSDGWLEKARKRNPEFSEKIENASEDSISFGHAPTFVIGYVTGNSTASGENTFGDTTTRRTISMDFDTEDHLFISSKNVAEKSICKVAAKTLYKGWTLHAIAESYMIAEKRGRAVCSQSLSDLNFIMKDYRLNRYNFIPLEDDFTPEFWPMYFNYKIEEKAYSIPIGYCYSKGNNDYIDININVPFTKKQLLIIWGAITAVVAVVALILLL